MEKPRELQGHPNVESRAICSQAAKAEGSEAIQYGVGSSDPKCAASQVDDEMVRTLPKGKAVYVCRACGKSKILPDDFYGANRKCKDCVKERVLAYQRTPKGREVHRRALARWNKTESAKLSSKRYKKSDKGIAAERRYQSSLRKRNPDKVKARFAVQMALQKGDLVRPNECERCGSTEFQIDAHHPDYSKPIEVEWLCQPCHIVEHGSSEPC